MEELRPRDPRRVPAVPPSSSAPPLPPAPPPPAALTFSALPLPGAPPGARAAGAERTDRSRSACTVFLLSVAAVVAVAAGTTVNDVMNGAADPPAARPGSTPGAPRTAAPPGPATPRPAASAPPGSPGPASAPGRPPSR